MWDSRLTRGVKNFRREATEIEYKAGRDNDLLATAHEHDSDIQMCVEALGGINMFPGIMEADDVIGWITHNLPGDITVVSVDQDMLQLINNNVQVYSPIKKVMVNISNFKQHTGVDTPENFLKYKALIGDKSDNIPGIPRVGKKTALKIINEGIDKSLLDRSENDQSIYQKNMKLMDLSHGYTVHEDEIPCYREQFEKLSNAKHDLSLFKKLCFKKDKKRCKTCLLYTSDAADE